MARTPSAQASPRPSEVLAKQVLRTRSMWAVPVIVGSIVMVLITAFYIGSVVDPVAHLHGLPVSVVNEDTGATIAGRTVDFGVQVQSGLTGSRTVARLLSLEPQTLAAAKRRMDSDGAYATLVIPPQFTASLLALTGLHPPGTPALRKPTVELLANARAGNQGVSLASGVLAPAIAHASTHIGQQLLAGARSAQAAIPAAAGVLADPITFSTVQYRPLPPHSALGLSAFYVALLTIIFGFFGSVLINSSVDAGLGYAATEIGPKWDYHKPLAISRWQTLLAKWAMAAVLTGYYDAVVVKLGADGAVYAAGGTAPGRVPAAPAAVRDTTGAGVAFCAGFLAAWLGGAPLGAACAAAAATAARAVCSLGGRPGG